MRIAPTPVLEDGTCRAGSGSGSGRRTDHRQSDSSTAAKGRPSSTWPGKVRCSNTRYDAPRRSVTEHRRLYALNSSGLVRPQSGSFVEQRAGRLAGARPSEDVSVALPRNVKTLPP